MISGLSLAYTIFSVFVRFGSFTKKMSDYTVFPPRRSSFFAPGFRLFYGRSLIGLSSSLCAIELNRSLTAFSYFFWSFSMAVLNLFCCSSWLD
jgi:hypothetical protein